MLTKYGVPIARYKLEKNITLKKKKKLCTFLFL